MIGRSPLIRMNGGIGDMLLLTIITQKIFNDTGRKVNLFSKHPQIFDNNSSVNHVFSEENLSYKAQKFIRSKFYEVTYRCWSNLLPGKANVFKAHVVEQFCNQLGLIGNIPLKPDLLFSSEELLSFENQTLPKPYVVAQSQASHSNHPQKTKDWGIKSMQSVVNALSRNFQVIQLGSSQDVALDKVTQLAGKTTIREAGLFLSQATLFIGLEGALMHLARAVDCPSVIVWGGRLKPSQIGYPCFENLYQDMDCSPCWIPNACPHSLACMKAISPKMVLERADKILSKTPKALTIDRISVKKSMSPKEIGKQIQGFPPHLDHLVSTVA